MTNEEAIDILRNAAWLGTNTNREQTEKAVEMAINALTKEAWKEEHPVSPLLQNLQPTFNLASKSDDTISRQAAIDVLEERLHANGYSNVALVSEFNRSIGYLRRLPSVQPERPTGKWIATTSSQEGQITWRDYKCSICSHHREKPMNFCEVCGAKMER